VDKLVWLTGDGFDPRRGSTNRCNRADRIVSAQSLGLALARGQTCCAAVRGRAIDQQGPLSPGDIQRGVRWAVRTAPWPDVRSGTARRTCEGRA